MPAEDIRQGLAGRSDTGLRRPERLVVRVLACALAGLVSTSVAWAREEAPAPPAPAPQVAEAPEVSIFREAAEPLGLSDEQIARLEAISEESGIYASEIKTKIKATRSDLRALLEQDEPDFVAVMAIADELGALETSRRKHQLTTLLGMRALLTPEQRANLMPVFRELNQRKRPPGRAMKRGKAEPRADAGGDRAENAP